MTLVSGDANYPFKLARLDQDSKLVVEADTGEQPESLDNNGGTENQVEQLGFDPGALMGMDSMEVAAEDKPDGVIHDVDTALAPQAEGDSAPHSPKAGEGADVKEDVDLKEEEEEELVKEEEDQSVAAAAGDEDASGFHKSVSDQPESISMGDNGETEEVAAVFGKEDALLEAGEPEPDVPVGVVEEAVSSIIHTEADGIMEDVDDDAVEEQEGADRVMEEVNAEGQQEAEAEVKSEEDQAMKKDSEPLVLSLPADLESALVVPVLGPHKALQVGNIRKSAQGTDGLPINYFNFEPSNWFGIFSAINLMANYLVFFLFSAFIGGVALSACCPP